MIAQRQGERLDRTVEEAIRRLAREKTNRVLDGAPSQEDGEELDFAFDGTYLRIKYQGNWYRSNNTWVQE